MHCSSDLIRSQGTITSSHINMFRMRAKCRAKEGLRQCRAVLCRMKASSSYVFASVFRVLLSQSSKSLPPPPSVEKDGSKERKRLFTVLGFYFSEVPRGGNKKALGWLTGGDVKCLPLQREVFRLPLTNCFPSQSFPRKIHIFYASGSNSLLKEKTLTNMMADGCRGSSLLISLFLPIALIFHL